MPSAPPEFVERLQSVFDGRLRIRWSNALNEYHIEQRVARGIINFPPALSEDETIRLQDGYIHIMSIRNGDRMPCPKCQRTLRVPVREIRELSCATCKASKVEHRVAAGFFPLDDTLITHLQSIDPLKGMSKALRNKIDAHNESFTASQRQAVLDHAYSRGAEDFARIAGIPSVGFTGKETMWDRGV